MKRDARGATPSSTTPEARLPQEDLQAHIGTARLVAVITLGETIHVDFTGAWTGRDIQVAMAHLPQAYARFQQRRLREARAVTTAPVPVEDSNGG